MHTYESSPSDLLHAYLDGDLNGVQEAVLFRQLADSEELRSALRDLLALRSLVQEDKDQLLPPGALRRNILMAVQTPRRQIFGLFGWNMRIAAALFCAAMIGGLLSFGITTFATRPHDRVRLPMPTAAAASGERNEKPKMNNQKPELNNHLPSSGPAQALVSGAARHNNHPSVHRQEAESFPDRTISSSEEPASASLTFAADMPRFPLHSLRDDYRIPSPSLITADAGAGIREDSPSISDDRAMKIHLRGYAAQNYPAPSITSQSDPWFRNMALGLSYSLSMQQSIGVEIGQENFSQIFRGQEGSRKIRYEQNPLLFWYGVSYRYTMAPVESSTGIRPYIGMIVAATGVGPLGRATGGMEYMPDRRVALSLGIEASLLSYRFQNAWNTSRKLGITYEMSILF